MTLIVAWVSKDNKPKGKGVSALYIGADSRFSWLPSNKVMNIGPKTFACVNSPDIFGFCGDVTLCNSIITQLKTRIESDCFFDQTDDISEKVRKVEGFINSAISEWADDLLQSFTIVYGTRIGYNFSLAVFDYKKKSGLKISVPVFPEDSNQIYIGGSGADDFRNKWIEEDSPNNVNYHTSRNVFHSLVESIDNSTDPATGGYPQVVCIYRGGNAKVIGIIHEGKRIIGGMDNPNVSSMTNLEWRNNKFERTNPETMVLNDGAQFHYFPQNK